MISEAFNALDRLEKERSLSANTSPGQEAATRNQQSNFFQWMWSGLRDTWRSLRAGS
jgi:hypothetical protein